MVNLRATIALAIAVAFATPSFSKGVPEATPVITQHKEHLLYKNACASYYSYGHITASGLQFHKNGLTAASKTLPFGTILRVTNKANGDSVRVMITDRGPYVHGRSLDLSLAAARKLDMLKTGTAQVTAYME